MAFSAITPYLVIIGLLVISALPLFFAVKIMGGRTGILKVILVNVIVGIVAYYIHSHFAIWGTIAAFIALLFIYKIMFRIGFIKALIAWALQFVILFVLLYLFIVILGIGLSLPFNLPFF